MVYIVIFFLNFYVYIICCNVIFFDSFREDLFYIIVFSFIECYLCIRVGYMYVVLYGLDSFWRFCYVSVCFYGLEFF